MNHDAVSIQMCLKAGLSEEQANLLLSRLASRRDPRDVASDPEGKLVHDFNKPLLAAAGITSDGSTASYYELPPGATELQHLISHRDMNAQIGEIFRACYRYGVVAHSPKLRDIKKIIFYAKAELERLEKEV